MSKDVKSDFDADEPGGLSLNSEYDDDLGVPDTPTVDGGILGSLDHPEDEQIQAQMGIIPFSAVHAPAVKFKKQHDVFIPGEAVDLRIIDYERNVTSHPLNPNLYTIEFTHGPFVWTVKKRYKHIQHLHNQLKLYRATLNIPFPTKSHRERRNSLKNLGEAHSKMRSRGALPRFPNKPDGLVSYEHLGHRMQVLEDYLRNLLKIEIYKRHPETVSFLELSRLSFIADLGSKGKESIILKRTGSSSKSGCTFCGLVENMCCVWCGYMCTALWGTWHTRHLVVKDTFIAYIRPKDGQIKSVILMDNCFEVSSGMYATGLRNGLQIMNSSRHIVIKCWTRRKAREWLQYIQTVANGPGRLFIQPNPHNSFAPYRADTLATWFVDGADYMSAVADALELAREEIFIADWWLSPEIHLKRPVTSDHWRLDKILQRKARAGVKVFVMIYKEVELALGINSYYSKQRLVAGCPENIKVFRHPDHARVGVLLWAHHEKIVVIDQKLAFTGGLDLCYGRWDTSEHRLTDLGTAGQSSIFIPTQGRVTSTSSRRVVTLRVKKHVVLPLAVATNTIAMVTTGCMSVLPVPGPTKCPPTPRLEVPLPEEGAKCNTPETQRRNLFEKARTTVEKVRENVKIGRKELINMVYSPCESGCDEGDNAGVIEATDVRSILCSVDPARLPRGCKLWLGKDYTNFIVKDFYDLQRPYDDLVDRSTTPRMPWHDVGVLMHGAAARDVARHFIQRWNATKLEKAKFNNAYPFLLPKSYGDCSSPPILPDKTHNVRCQVLRSVSSWSAGYLESDTVEQSIHEAYIHAIANAEKFIYIENQFFITLATLDRQNVRNHVGETLLKRILRAHREGSVFRVFVVMPLLPGFEGEVGGPTGTALHAITHWNYASISRGRDSLLRRLVEADVDPTEYISFHGLRSYSLLNGTLVTELIYVHSKLMIVDDKTVICGSANINDRSMIATRDSEIAVIIHDQEFNEGRMNNTPYPCGKFVGSLRKQLFREHLGLLWDDDVNVDDPVKSSFFSGLWKARSHANTEIFEMVFRCIPSDEVQCFSGLKEYQNGVPLCLTDPAAAQDLLKGVKGHLVDLPLEFLKLENLTPGVSTVEGMMPTSLWT